MKVDRSEGEKSQLLWRFRLANFARAPLLQTVAFLVFWISGVSIAEAQRHEFEATRMGAAVRIVLYSDDAAKAEKAAAAALDRMETLNGILTDYDSDSELSTLCRRSTDAFENGAEEGVWIPVGDDLFTVLKAAKHFGNLSDGAFDITVGPMVRLWRRARRQRELPKPIHVDRARESVGRDLWEIDENDRRVRLLRKGMRLDLGGIAKGYVIDRAFETLREHGMKTCLVDAGGDIRVGDAPPDGWKIELSDGELRKLENVALATSGDTFQFVDIQGVRYSHLIDPKTGLGLTESRVVHLAAPTAMEADALASAVSVLGPEKGLALIETLKNVSCEIIVSGKDQAIRSTGW